MTHGLSCLSDERMLDHRWLIEHSAANCLSNYKIGDWAVQRDQNRSWCFCISVNLSPQYLSQVKHRLGEVEVVCFFFFFGCSCSSLWGNWACCIWWVCCSSVMCSGVSWDPVQGLRLRGLHCLRWWFPYAGKGSSQTLRACASNQEAVQRYLEYLETWHNFVIT